MAHIFIPRGIRVVLQCEGPSGQEFLNVFHVQTANTPVTYTDCSAVATLVSSWWNANYRNLVTSSVKGRQVVATSTESAPGPQASLAITPVGSRTGTDAPADVSMCVKLSTNSSGRRHRGRWYTFPPVTTDLTVQSTFQIAYVNAVLGVLGNLASTLLAGGYPLAIASYTAAALYPVTRFVAVDDVIDSQRRRLPGRGR